ncbi:MAG TPA: cardiolipin synthase B [Zetaproteobacteria bacterium]|nr:cardiolipin synthase B [Zetaproteobacteria bacterium]
MAAHNPYPVRSGNTFRLLSGADALMPAMLDAIRGARRYVLLEQYLVSSGELTGRLIEALIDCAQRRIPVYMLLDHFGCRGLGLGDRQRLRDAGVHLAFYNPAYLSHFLRALPRNHGKMLIIDGQMAFTGGAGITDDYRTDTAILAWHDVIVEMRGPIVGDWQAMFTLNWERWGGRIDVLPAETWQPGAQRGRLAVSLRGLKKFVRRALILNIGHASGRVWLATAYWLPGRAMLRALRAASRRGADVRLLLPGPTNDHPAVYHAGHRYYHYLLRNGVRIFEYQPAFMHAKLYLCDDWVSVGSSNMDRWGLRWNLEANLESKDTALSAETRAFFSEAFAQSQEITFEAWRQRPVINRLREWLFGYLDLIIERFGSTREMQRNVATGAAERQPGNTADRGVPNE